MISPLCNLSFFLETFSLGNLNLNLFSTNGAILRFSLLCGSSFPNRAQSSRQLTIARNRKFILWSFVPREGWKNEGDVYNQREPEVPKSPNTIFYGYFMHLFRNDDNFLSLSFKQCFFFHACIS